MNASLTDFDQNALSTHVAADQGGYHISIDAGPYHVAYADIRLSCSSVKPSIDIAPGNPSPRLRRCLIDAVFDLERYLVHVDALFARVFGAADA